MPREKPLLLRRLSDGLKDDGRGLLDAVEALSESVRVALVELDVVDCGLCVGESDAAAHDEGDGLGFGLPAGLRATGPPSPWWSIS